MSNPNPKKENLTNAGKGRRVVSGKVRLTCSISAETKRYLQRLGTNQAGAEIDRLCRAEMDREEGGLNRD